MRSATNAEYAQQATFAIGAIEWAALHFVDGRSPDWSQEPQDLAGQFEHDNHDCDRHLHRNDHGDYCTPASAR
jgi:hypothetical protein